jgi:hypothetical protein
MYLYSLQIKGDSNKKKSPGVDPTENTAPSISSLLLFPRLQCRSIKALLFIAILVIYLITASIDATVRRCTLSILRENHM